MKVRHNQLQPVSDLFRVVVWNPAKANLIRNVSQPLPNGFVK